MSQIHTKLMHRVHFSVIPTAAANHSLGCPGVLGGLIFTSVIPTAKHGVVPELRGMG